MCVLTILSIGRGLKRDTLTVRNQHKNVVQRLRLLVQNSHKRGLTEVVSRRIVSDVGCEKICYIFVEVVFTYFYKRVVMSRMLTHILSHAVPDVRVESARVTCAPLQGDCRHYFIFVYPSHGIYWARFKERYFYWKRVALEYEAEAVEAACPEFNTRESLMNWLFDVLVLSRGERDLLKLGF